MVSNYFAIRNIEAKLAPTKTKGYSAVVPYITNGLNS